MAGFAGAGWLAWFSYDLTTGLPDRQALRGLGDMAQATTLFDVSDQPVFTIFKEQRIEVPLDEDVAEPDQGGRVGRGSALLRAQRHRRRPHRRRRRSQTCRPGARAEGGSTITQQLARQSFLTPRQDLPPQAEGSRSSPRYIERNYTKNEILELYLNKVYFGDGLYGVEAASRGYLRQARQRARRSTRRRCSPA